MLLWLRLSGRERRGQRPRRRRTRGAARACARRAPRSWTAPTSPPRSVGAPRWREKALRAARGASAPAGRARETAHAPNFFVRSTCARSLAIRRKLLTRSWGAAAGRVSGPPARRRRRLPNLVRLQQPLALLLLVLRLLPNHVHHRHHIRLALSQEARHLSAPARQRRPVHRPFLIRRRNGTVTAADRGTAVRPG